jgi:xylulose-5-phosphate/fructose-6-phosphate phosphoketolase
MPLDNGEIAAIDAWWRAADYLSVGQIYLLDNRRDKSPVGGW